MAKVVKRTMPDGTQRFTCGHPGHEDTVQRFGERTCPDLGPICMLDDRGQHVYGAPHGGTTERMPCGCHVDGVGNLLDPLRVHHCHAHDGQPQLLAALQAILHAARDGPVLERDAAYAQGRAAIARASGAASPIRTTYFAAAEECACPPDGDSSDCPLHGEGA